MDVAETSIKAWAASAASYWTAEANPSGTAAARGGTRAGTPRERR